MEKKFRKKPVVIEAIQLINTPKRIHEVMTFIQGKPVDNYSCQMAADYWDNYVQNCIERGKGIYMKTLESDGESQLASFGDWIIKGVHGEFYPCKPDVFEKTYEPVD